MVDYRSAEAVIRFLGRTKGQVPDGFREAFERADKAFLYQVVFDSEAVREVRLNPLPPGMEDEDLDYAGTIHEPEQARAHARGELDSLS